jgi:hypothetical protein
MLDALPKEAALVLVLAGLLGTSIVQSAASLTHDLWVPPDVFIHDSQTAQTRADWRHDVRMVCVEGRSGEH